MICFRLSFQLVRPMNSTHCKLYWKHINFRIHFEIIENTFLFRDVNLNTITRKNNDISLFASQMNSQNRNLEIFKWKHKFIICWAFIHFINFLKDFSSLIKILVILLYHVTCYLLARLKLIRRYNPYI